MACLDFDDSFNSTCESNDATPPQSFPTCNSEFDTKSSSTPSPTHKTLNQIHSGTRIHSNTISNLSFPVTATATVPAVGGGGGAGGVHSELTSAPAGFSGSATSKNKKNSAVDKSKKENNQNFIGSELNSLNIPRPLDMNNNNNYPNINYVSGNNSNNANLCVCVAVSISSNKKNNKRWPTRHVLIRPLKRYPIHHILHTAANIDSFSQAFIQGQLIDSTLDLSNAPNQFTFNSNEYDNPNSSLENIKPFLPEDPMGLAYTPSVIVNFVVDTLLSHAMKLIAFKDHLEMAKNTFSQRNMFYFYLCVYNEISDICQRDGYSIPSSCIRVFHPLNPKNFPFSNEESKLCLSTANSILSAILMKKGIEHWKFDGKNDRIFFAFKSKIDADLIHKNFHSQYSKSMPFSLSNENSPFDNDTFTSFGMFSKVESEPNVNYSIKMKSHFWMLQVTQAQSKESNSNKRNKNGSTVFYKKLGKQLKVNQKEVEEVENENDEHDFISADDNEVENQATWTHSFVEEKDKPFKSKRLKNPPHPPARTQTHPNPNPNPQPVHLHLPDDLAVPSIKVEQKSPTFQNARIVTSDNNTDERDNTSSHFNNNQNIYTSHTRESVIISKEKLNNARRAPVNSTLSILQNKTDGEKDSSLSESMMNEIISQGPVLLVYRDAIIYQDDLSKGFITHLESLKEGFSSRPNRPNKRTRKNVTNEGFQNHNFSNNSANPATSNPAHTGTQPLNSSNPGIIHLSNQNELKSQQSFEQFVTDSLSNSDKDDSQHASAPASGEGLGSDSISSDDFELSVSQQHIDTQDYIRNGGANSLQDLYPNSFQTHQEIHFTQSGSFNNSNNYNNPNRNNLNHGSNNNLFHNMNSNRRGSVSQSGVMMIPNNNIHSAQNQFLDSFQLQIPLPFPQQNVNANLPDDYYAHDRSINMHDHQLNNNLTHLFDQGLGLVSPELQHVDRSPPNSNKQDDAVVTIAPQTGDNKQKDSSDPNLHKASRSALLFRRISSTFNLIAASVHLTPFSLLIHFITAFISLYLLFRHSSTNDFFSASIQFPQSPNNTNFSSSTASPASSYTNLASDSFNSLKSATITSRSLFSLDNDRDGDDGYFGPNPYDSDGDDTTNTLSTPSTNFSVTSNKSTAVSMTPTNLVAMSVAILHNMCSASWIFQTWFIGFTGLPLTNDTQFFLSIGVDIPFFTGVALQAAIFEKCLGDWVIAENNLSDQYATAVPTSIYRPTCNNSSTVCSALVNNGVAQTYLFQLVCQVNYYLVLHLTTLNGYSFLPAFCGQTSSVSTIPDAFCNFLFDALAITNTTNLFFLKYKTKPPTHSAKNHNSSASGNSFHDNSAPSHSKSLQSISDAPESNKNSPGSFKLEVDSLVDPDYFLELRNNLNSSFLQHLLNFSESQSAWLSNPQVFDLAYSRALQLMTLRTSLTNTAVLGSAAIAASSLFSITSSSPTAVPKQIETSSNNPSPSYSSNPASVIWINLNVTFVEIFFILLGAPGIFVIFQLVLNGFVNILQSSLIHSWHKMNEHCFRSKK